MLVRTQRAAAQHVTVEDEGDPDCHRRRQVRQAILGDPMEESNGWMALLAAFDLLYWSLCGVLYGRVVEE